MPLLKSRPKIRLQVPNEIRVGQTFEALVLLDCRREVRIEELNVVLEGTEGWRIGSSNHAVSRRYSLLRLAARLSGQRVLPVGQSRFPVRIPLPGELPPSIHGTAVRIEYELAVHASIDWWPDARAAFEIKVVPGEAPSPETATRVYSSDPAGPRGREPHVELGLASTWTRVGDVVSGSFALANVAFNRYSEVKVGLTGTEQAYDARSLRAERRHASYAVRIGAEQVEEGEMVPFRFRLPSDVVSGYEREPRPGGSAGLSALRWSFENRGGHPLGQRHHLAGPLLGAAGFGAALPTRRSGWRRPRSAPTACARSGSRSARSSGCATRRSRSRDTSARRSSRYAAIISAGMGST